MDIRRGGVPILRSNLICFGYSDGVVVGDEGKGLLEGNTIYGESRSPWGQVWGPVQPEGRKHRFHLQLVGPERVTAVPWASSTSFKNQPVSQVTAPLRRHDPFINHLLIQVDPMGSAKQRALIPT